jgi:hypothetical protein
VEWGSGRRKPMVGRKMNRDAKEALRSGGGEAGVGDAKGWCLGPDLVRETPRLQPTHDPGGRVRATVAPHRAAEGAHARPRGVDVDKAARLPAGRG